MFRINKLLLVITVLCIVFISAHLRAEIITAASAEFEDVQNAVESAQTGDVVLIPAGNATWESTLDIPNDKKITLQGSGKVNTVISSTSSAPGTLISLGLSGSRITDIGFILINDNGGGILCDGNGWRIDNCSFENTTSNIIEGVYARGYYNDDLCPTGVVDHCEFINARVLVVGDAILMTNKIWAEPLGLGTNNAVFVEDCTFDFTDHGNAIDANYGGRYVFRYNEMTDVYIEAHSVQGTHRATRSWEIYGNKIHQKNRGMWAPFFLRGGTGVVFDNEITGEWSSGPVIIVDNVRSFREAGEGGICDGTSPWDGNEEPNGYPARDQIGRSTDQWLWTDENPYPPQELDPFYQWNNTHNGSPISVYVHNNSGIHIKENRDYYNNVEKPGYQPYEYPHPLVTDTPTGNTDDDGTTLLIKEYWLSQNYPNPFNPATTIKYSIPASSLPRRSEAKTGRQFAAGSQNNQSFNQPITKSNSDLLIVQLKVYNILGKEVATLVNEQQRPGIYEVRWEASNLSSGVYFYQLKAGNFNQVKKLLLMK